MVAQLLDGKKIAAQIMAKVQQAIASFPQKPRLAIVRCGDDPASVLYTAMKQKKAEEIGIQAELYVFSSTVNQQEVIEKIQCLNATVDGIMVQLPLPAHLSERQVCDAIDIDKDVDGLTQQSLAQVMNNQELHAPATPKAVIRLLDEYHLPLAGKNVVIVGRSTLIGKPLAMMALHRDATVSICHSKTPDLAKHTCQADVLISAVGKQHFITPDMIKEDAIVIDVGISKQDNQIKGDIHPDVIQKAAFLAPVPGGVGPMTIAMLLEAVAEAKIYKMNQMNLKEKIKQEEKSR